jgi:hypothetical protein
MNVSRQGQRQIFTYLQTHQRTVHIFAESYTPFTILSQKAFIIPDCGFESLLHHRMPLRTNWSRQRTLAISTSSHFSSNNFEQLPMATLLTIPREIRDEIWKLCIVSQTGFMAPLSRNTAFYRRLPRSTSSSGPHYYLVVANPNADTYNMCPPYENGFIILSLPRTCRQIYNETSHLFWTSNIFIFREPHNLICTFKGMGQTPSRCITSIRLSLGLIEGNVLEIFKKAIDLLLKRQSTSALRLLDLVLNAKQLAVMSCMKKEFPCGNGLSHRPKPLSGRWYDDLLTVLARGSQITFERRILAGPGSWQPTVGETEEELNRLKEWAGYAQDTLLDLHLAGVVLCSGMASSYSKVAIWLAEAYWRKLRNISY